MTERMSQDDQMDELEAASDRASGKTAIKQKCFWCGQEKYMSTWEQEHHAKGWHRLCKPCATRRLNNPFNALLKMRKVQL